MKDRVGSSRRLALLFLLPAAAHAHDPIFGLGPHTLFKGGVELHAGLLREVGDDERETEYGVAVKYGLTADWVVGIEAPFVDLRSPGGSMSGWGDVALSTKYRFWRDDRLGVQESAAFSLAAILDTASEDDLGAGATDAITGLTYGYEGRKWYRWASLRYRRNGSDHSGIDRGDRVLLDLVGGIRFKPTGYLQPDWVWMIELNGEYGERARRNGEPLRSTGGTEWFLSPGLMWTWRNYAVKTGLQLPVFHDLNGSQEQTDYRLALEFEVHL